MKKIILFIFFFTVCLNCAVGAPKYEIRAVWLTTIGGLDWPHSYAHDGFGIGNQQRELCNILDKYVEAGFNTVIFQTRVRGTVAYPSFLEPWEGAFSGVPGMSPGYDVLSFVIDECHKRGLKIHAWIVTIPLGKWNEAGCENLRKAYPNLVKKIGDEGFMNPELVGTGDYLANICSEVVKKYDIDGIHLDYIRYPETWGKIADRYKARDNINHIVETIHNRVKSIKPWVALSCSPVGKYADTKRARSGGWNARDAVCQDAALWLKEGWMDIIFPMMYFKGNNFYPFVMDWKERSSGKIVVPGLGIYFMHPSEKDWSLTDITREMNVSRQYGMGTCFFRSDFFTSNLKGLYDYTKNTYSTSLSLPPAMSWLSGKRPVAPHHIGFVESEDGGMLLKWDVNNEGNMLLYNIYGSSTSYVDVNVGDNILMANYDETSIEFPVATSLKWLAVTSVDRYGNESQPRILWLDQEIGDDAMYHQSRMLTCDEFFLYLDHCDIDTSQVVEIHSIEGAPLTARLTHSQGESCVIDIFLLQRGHYKAYWVTRKGDRHLLGRFYKQ